MEYIITSYKTSKKGININGAHLYAIEGNHANNVLIFSQATDKGWKSAKPILIDFPYTENTTDYTTAALAITQEVAEALIAKYKGVRIKTFSRYSDDKAIRNLALCEYMHDPYDNSGSFSDESLSKGH
jgi:hypothetical protein